MSFATHRVEGLQGGTIYNLSTEGCAVESPTMVETGTNVALYIHAPGEKSPIAIDLATILWGGRRVFGARFQVVQSEEKKRLDRLVQKLLRPKA
jgi:hypothetical protein